VDASPSSENGKKGASNQFEELRGGERQAKDETSILSSCGQRKRVRRIIKHVVKRCWRSRSKISHTWRVKKNTSSRCTGSQERRILGVQGSLQEWSRKGAARREGLKRKQPNLSGGCLISESNGALSRNQPSLNQCILSAGRIRGKKAKMGLELYHQKTRKRKEKNSFPSEAKSSLVGANGPALPYDVGSWAGSRSLARGRPKRGASETHENHSGGVSKLIFSTNGRKKKIWCALKRRSHSD